MARRIRPITLDVTFAFGNEPDQANMILDDLRKRRLYNPHFLYHGFDADKELENMLREGVKDKGADTFFGGTEKELFDYDTANPLFYAFCDSHAKAGLAVYDGNFVEFGKKGDFTYGFLDPDRKLDALVAVYILKDNEMQTI